MENKINYSEMSEFEARDYILNKGREAKSTEDIFELIEEVKTNFNYNYGVAPRSIAAVCVALANYLSGEMGLTGFQAGFVMTDFMFGYQYNHNKCGIKILDYDDMLYPQHEQRFDKIITPHVWECIQRSARKKLSEDKYHAHDKVIEHWQSIVDGKVPFGYKVENS